MDRSKLSRRKSKWKEYQYANADKLIDWGKNKGITGDTDFVLAEVFSRVVGLKALKNSSASTIVQAPLTAHYDLITDGGTRIDVKFRTNDSSDYQTELLSESKINFDEADQILYVLWDGVCRLYESHSYRKIREKWPHKDKTAKEGNTIVEKGFEYYPEDAIWTTTITLPYDLIQ